MLAASAFDCDGGYFGNFVGLGVNFVIFEALGADGREGAEADLERDFCYFDAPTAHASENFRREMQTRCGRCDSTSLLRVNGLVALAVERLVGALDIGRERDVAEAIDRFG